MICNRADLDKAINWMREGRPSEVYRSIDAEFHSYRGRKMYREKGEPGVLQNSNPWRFEDYYGFLVAPWVVFELPRDKE